MVAHPQHACLLDCSGTLPAAIRFGAGGPLAEMRLNGNRLAGLLPSEWGESAGAQALGALRILDLSNNLNLSGTSDYKHHAAWHLQQVDIDSTGCLS